MAQEIKIIAVPPGQAPEWVRKEWVGLTMPIAENLPPNTFAMGVLGGKSKNPNGYPIETFTAINILAKKSPKAAQWWINCAILGQWLVFKTEVCQLL